MKKSIFLTLLLPLLLIGCNPQKKNGTPSEDKNPTVEPGDNDPKEPSKEDGGEGSGTQTIPVSSVNLDKSSLEIYIDEENVSLTATVLPENATDKSVTWSSSDKEVATVDNGVITPKKAGNTVITVTTNDGDKTATCDLTVKENITFPNYVLHGLFNGNSEWMNKQMQQNPSTSSEYMIQGITLHVNDLFKIHMDGDTWYGYSDIKTSVASALVAKGESDDNIKVLKTGTYDIYSNYDFFENGHIYIAKVDEGGDTPSTVNVTGISLNRTGKFLVVRNEYQLEATIYPENATNKDVSWSSSDNSIATVTSGGRVVAKEKRGSTTITAKTADGNKIATCLIYVSPSNIPDYYLTGTINGRSYKSGTYTYAALPLSTGKYLIPDVELVNGDELSVTGSNGATLKNKYNQPYKYQVTKKMSVNIYLDINEASKNYLSFVDK